MPLWFRGFLDLEQDLSHDSGSSWYCVDISVDDVFSQREIRLSNNRKRTQQSIKHYEYEEEEEGRYHHYHHRNLLTDGNPIFLKKRDKLGLEILPELTSFSLGNGDAQITVVALGSFIYSAGGFTYTRRGRNTSDGRLCRNLHCLDTKNQHEGWKTFKMMTGRAQQLMAILGGMIYIMGGKHKSFGDRLCNDNDGYHDLYVDDSDGYRNRGNDGTKVVRYDADTDPWGEVFDPATGKSELMPEIPDEFLKDCSPVHDGFADIKPPVKDDKILNEHNLVVFTNQNSIVLCSRGSGRRIYYEIDKQSWSNVVFDEVLASHTYWPCNYIHTKAYVVVGTTMYWISNMLGLSAYDFTTRRLYKSGDIDKYICKGRQNYYGKTKLIHLNGDNFCIVWVINKAANDYDQTRMKKRMINKSIAQK